jgi:signal transduction histidine kinase
MAGGAGDKLESIRKDVRRAVMVENGRASVASALSKEQIAYLLSRIDLFETFPPTTLRQVAQECTTLSLQPRAVLFEHGSSGSSLYIVVDGGLEVFRSDRVIANISRNEYIGELSLLDPGVRAASVRAVGPTVLVELSQEAFEHYLRKEPEPLAAMMRTITRRLRGMLDDTQAAYEHLNMQVHDMLNLVNVLAGAGLVADALPANDEHHRYLEIILHTRDRLEVMMRDALRRASGVTAAYAKSSNDVESLVRECLDSDLALHPDLDHIETLVRANAALPPCSCNAGDLQRVIANLVINAAQAMSGRGHITITITQHDGQARIGVTDDGPGIQPEVLPHIFDTHFTTKPQGTGLGLSSCKLIVEGLHGGQLTCDSVPGQGTTFTVDIPL